MRNSLDSLDSFTKNVTKYLSCVELDKFEAVPDEEELVRRGMKLIKSNKLWAGLVFLDVKEGKTERREIVKVVC